MNKLVILLSICLTLILLNTNHAQAQAQGDLSVSISVEPVNGNVLDSIYVIATVYNYGDTSYDNVNVIIYGLLDWNQPDVIPQKDPLPDEFLFLTLDTSVNANDSIVVQSVCYPFSYILPLVSFRLLVDEYNIIEETDETNNQAIIYLGLGYVDSCCQGERGDIDEIPGFDVSDLVYLIDVFFNDGPVPDCIDESDANGDGGLDISDLTLFVDYMFNDGQAPAPCGYSLN